MPYPLTSHVLDTRKGRPAAGVTVHLERQADGAHDWQYLGEGRTDGDGRTGFLPGEATLPRGIYRLTFDVGTYLGEESFYPRIPIIFKVDHPTQHYHVPLLLSPFGYTTYRGS